MAAFEDICLTALALRKKAKEEIEAERAKLEPERNAIIVWAEAAPIDQVRRVAEVIRALKKTVPLPGAADDFRATSGTLRKADKRNTLFN